MVIRPHIVSSNGSWKIGISGAIPDNWRMLVYRDWPAVHTVYLAGFPDYTSVPKMSSLSGFSIIFPGFLQVNNYFFFIRPGTIYGLAPTPLIRFWYGTNQNVRNWIADNLNIYLSKYIQLCRAIFSKNGAGGGKPSPPTPPQHPKNFERSILLASQFPTRISKNCDSSYYNARDLATFKTSTIKKNFFQKMIEWKMTLFRFHPRELKG